MDSILASISIIAPRASVVQGWWPCDDSSNGGNCAATDCVCTTRGRRGPAPNMAIYRRDGVGSSYIAHGGLVMILHG